MLYTSEERQEFLLGQTTALAAFAQSVVLTHPDPAALLATFEVQLLKAEAKILYGPVGESFLAGARYVQALLYPAGTNPAEDR